MNNRVITFLNFLKNASLAKKEHVEIDYTPFILKYVELLYAEGLILSYFTLNSKKKKIILNLRYVDGVCITSKIKLISKPTLIKSLPYYQICRLPLKGKTAFFSTDKGLVTLEDCKSMRLGGVFVFYC